MVDLLDIDLYVINNYNCENFCENFLTFLEKYIHGCEYKILDYRKGLYLIGVRMSQSFVIYLDIFNNMNYYNKCIRKLQECLPHSLLVDGIKHQLHIYYGYDTIAVQYVSDTWNVIIRRCLEFNNFDNNLFDLLLNIKICKYECIYDDPNYKRYYESYFSVYNFDLIEIRKINNYIIDNFDDRNIYYNVKTKLANLMENDKDIWVDNCSFHVDRYAIKIEITDNCHPSSSVLLGVY